MKKKKDITIKCTEQEYLSACNDDFGLCEACGMINDGFHEPDAREYECYHCGAEASMGFEWALTSMLVEIVDEEESNYADRF